jgi:hypothetical protein
MKPSPMCRSLVTLCATLLETWPDLDRHRLIHETVRRVISWMIFDVISQTRGMQISMSIETSQDVRQANRGCGFVLADMAGNNAQFKHSSRRTCTSMMWSRR